jgi:S1-C subfamily serine protease
LKLLRVAIVAAVCLAHTRTAFAQDLPALIARAAPAVVVLSDDGSPHGTGFVVSADGTIVTNLHVIARMKQPRVKLPDGRSFDAVSVIGYDKERDLAILRIPATGLPVLPLGDSRKVRVGQRVIAFGTPLGYSGTTTTGIVSAIRRHPKLPDARLLQTDAPINPGSSGGPLVDTKGRAVGVVTSMIYNAQSLGFAVPVDELRRLLKSSEHSIAPEDLRRYLLLTDWAPWILPRRWRAESDFYMSTAPGAVYELDGKNDAIRLTLLRPAAEASLGSKLQLSLLRSGRVFEGESSGDVACETLRASGKVPWRRDGAQISELSLERIELSFLAPSLPDPNGDCGLEFRRHRVTLTAVGETDAAPSTGEAQYLDSIRARRVAYEQRRERQRRDCVEIRAKLERECTQVTQWNATSCKTFDDLANVCSREGF